MGGLAATATLLGGCGDSGGGEASRASPATSAPAPPAPDSDDAGQDDAGADLDEQILTGLGDDTPPEWFPEVPLPEGLTGITAQQRGTGLFSLVGTLPSTPDRAAALAAYADVLQADGWTREDLVLGPAANEDTTDGFAATTGGQRLEVTYVSAEGDDLVSVLMQLSGF